MERNANPGSERNNTHAFLLNLFTQSADKSPEELAQIVYGLAFDTGNPVREHFLTAIPQDQRPPSPTPTVKPKASSKLLRFTRRENKNPASQNKQPIFGFSSRGQSNVPSGSENVAHGGGSHGARGSSTLSQTETPGNMASATQYSCIICNDAMSSKGVCKRHIDDQHVSRKIYKFEGEGGKCFDTKADAKKHAERYGLGFFSFNTIIPPAKLVYASEYTNELFTSKAQYVEHLLNLSGEHAERPAPSLHRKLRTLLGHPSIRPDAGDISEAIYGSRDAWQHLRWTKGDVQGAIQQLEDAAVAFTNGSIHFGGHLRGSQNSLNLPMFLQGLFHAGSLPEATAAPSMQLGELGSSSLVTSAQPGLLANTTERPGIAPFDRSVPILQSQACPPDIREPCFPRSTTFHPSLEEVPVLGQELKAKRHLSDPSRFYVPERQPPGPQSLGQHFEFPYSTGEQDLQRSEASSFMTADLPYRPQSQNDPTTLHHPTPSAITQMHPYDLNVAENYSTSAAASEVTLIPPYQEPELQSPITFNPILWPSDPNLKYQYNFDDPVTFGPPDANLHHASDIPVRTPSVATDQTYIGYSEDDQKLANYMSLHMGLDANLAAFPADDENGPQFHGTNG